MESTLQKIMKILHIRVESNPNNSFSDFQDFDLKIYLQ